MGKISKILLCGHPGVGKSAIIEQLLYGNHVVESVRLDICFTYPAVYSKALFPGIIQINSRACNAPQVACADGSLWIWRRWGQMHTLEFDGCDCVMYAERECQTFSYHI